MDNYAYDKGKIFVKEKLMSTIIKVGPIREKGKSSILVQHEKSIGS